MTIADEADDSADTLGIAIIGMAGRWPGANDLDQFWQNLHDGVESIRPLSDDELRALGATDLDEPNLVKAAAVMDDIENFDAAFFGYTPTEARLMDPQQRVFLETAWQALEDAGYEGGSFDGSIGVYAGTTISTYLLMNLMQNPNFSGQVDPVQIHIGNAGDFLTTRVSYKLNLKGPSHQVGSACSTSLVAVHLACQSLMNEECDMALAGGISINVKQRTGYRYIEGAMESPDGHCRAFDAQAQGTLFGCGTGAVVLKRLDDALADGDTIRAIIRGSALNNDGSFKVGFTAPSVVGQAAVISEALDMAGVEPDSISYIEAHGTGTALGDPIEIQALTKAYRASTEDRQFCGIGSVKTNLGHLEAAAGVTSLIKTVLALGHSQLPPSLNFKRPNPQIDFENSPFYVVDRLREWPKGPTPRRAGVSSFGFGGTNAHVIVEEAPTQSTTFDMPWQLLTLSARTPTALETVTTNLLNHLKKHPEQSLTDVAHTLRLGRKGFGQRRMLVCRDRQEAIERLENNSWTSSNLENIERPVVFMFPGQGSQYPGMGQEFYRGVPYFKEQVDRQSQLLEPYLGLKLTDWLYPKPDQLEAARQHLDQTSLTQPALFVVEYALARLWQKWGVQPQALVGHSIGEYVAATLAGVFALEDALQLVALRGKLMQEQPGGAMLAVSLTESELKPYLNSDLSLAALNDPRQCVVSGPTEVIDRLQAQLTAQEISASRLHTSHAFHSAMMQPIVERFAAEVSRVRRNAPKIPYLSNLTGQWITPQQATDPRYWADHLRQTVRFSDNLTLLGQNADQVLLEIGPGQALTKLARRHPAINSKQAIVSTLPTAKSQTDAAAWRWQVLGQIWLAGVKLDWQKVQPKGGRRIPLPTYPFERQRYWVDPLYKPGTLPNQIVIESAETSDETSKLPLSEWFYQPVWKLTSLPHSQTEIECDWLIFTDDKGPVSGLAQHLAQAGQKVIQVERGAALERRDQNTYRLRRDQNTYRLRPDQPDDYQQLWQALGQSEQPRRIVYGWDDQPDAFKNLLQLIQSLPVDEAAQLPQLTVITSQLVDVSGEGTIVVEKSSLIGLSKVARHEYPGLVCRLIDLASELDNSQNQTERLLAELQSEATEELVAYRGRRRWTLTYERVETAPPVSPEALTGPYLITEGLTNIGWGLAEGLASHGPVKLVLTGRQADEAKIDRLKDLGAEVLFVPVEPTDPAALAQAIAQGQQTFGELRGVIHAAPAALESVRRFESVSMTDASSAETSLLECYQTLTALETALPGDLQLDFCLIVSSLSSLLGGKGYLTYAASSTLLDSFVYRHNQTGRQPWLSVNWDAWQFEQDGPQITDLNSQLAEFALNGGEGYEVLRRLARPGLPDQVVVSTGRLSQRLRAAFKPSGQSVLTPTTQAVQLQPRPELSTLYAPPQTELEKQVAAIWQAALGFDRVGLHDNFFELGGESLAALQVIAQLKKKLSLDLPASSLYERLTVRALVDLIEAERKTADPQAEAALVAARETKVNRRKQFQEDQRLRRKKD